MKFVIGSPDDDREFHTNKATEAASAAARALDSGRKIHIWICNKRAALQELNKAADRESLAENLRDRRFEARLATS